MTGPEHYQSAEIAQEAAAAAQAFRTPGPEYTVTEALLDALVHAVLALAAANAGTDPDGGLSPAELKAWREVAGTRAPAEGEPS
jgi:hypothetical protein